MPLALLLLAIEATYVFIVSAGTFTTWSTWNTNYDLIAEGFRAGHLYIPVAPPPELLATPNPFDWSNYNLWFLDASLYKGHYYLYWAPFPALALLAIKIVFRIHAVIGDQYVLFASYTLLLVAGALLIDRVARRLFPQLPTGLSLLATVAFAYVTPTTFMLATPGIYQAAIGSAQALLVVGLLFAFDAVWSEAPPPSWRLLAASLSWSTAIACRVSAVLPVGALFLLTVVLVVPRRTPRWRAALADACWLGAPIALTLALLAAYNKARFDSWFEVGVKYQLNVFPFVTSRAYLPLNLFSYLFRPVGTFCRFPFISALYDIGVRGFPGSVRFPPGYTTHEPQAGLFVTAPWTLLALGTLAAVVHGVVRWCRRRPRVLPSDRRARATVFCLGAFMTLASLMPVAFIAAFGTTMRYLADFSTGFALLAAWGAFALVTRARRPWPRRLLTAWLVVLCALGVSVSVLLGFQGYDETLKQHNPALYQRLQKALSLCRR